MNFFPNRFRLLLCCLAIAGPLPAIRAAEPSVLDMVPRDAAAFVHIRVADTWKEDALKPFREFATKNPQVLKEMEANVGLSLAEVESVTAIVPEFGGIDIVTPPVNIVRTLKPYDKLNVLTAFKASASNRGEFEEPLIFPAPPVPKVAPSKSAPSVKPPQSSLPKPLGQGMHLISFRDPARVDLSARTYYAHHGEIIIVAVDERTLMFVISDREGNGLPGYVGRMLKRADHGPLDGALAAAAKNHSLAAGVDFAAAAKMLQKDFPPDLDKFKAVLKAKAATLVVDLKSEMSVALSLEVDDAANAKQIEEAAHSALDMALEALPAMMNPLFDKVKEALKSAKIDTQASTVRVAMAMKADRAVEFALKGAIEAVQQSAEKINSVNNLKQMGLATHNFHDTYGYLPFPGIDKDVKATTNNPNLSWRVALLPFMEQTNLYNQFHLNEPWDSEHNKKLVPMMPKIYAPPLRIETPKGYTFYRTFAGPETISTPPLTLIGIQDGTSNTIMVAEAADAVPWTKPDELVYDAKKPLPKLGGLFGGDFHVLLGDASVRLIPKDWPQKMVRAAITPSGGEVISWPAR